MRRNLPLVLSALTLALVGYLVLEVRAARSQVVDIQVAVDGIDSEIGRGTKPSVGSFRKGTTVQDELFWLIDHVGEPRPGSGGFFSGQPAGPRTLFEAAGGPDLSSIDTAITQLREDVKSLRTSVDMVDEAVGHPAILSGSLHDEISRVEDVVDAIDQKLQAICGEGGFVTC